MSLSLGASLSQKVTREDFTHSGAPGLFMVGWAPFFEEERFWEAPAGAGWGHAPAPKRE